MKIKIIKCSIPGAWYANRIGEVYEVWDKDGETGDCYGVARDSIRKFWYILKEDTKILNDRNDP